MQFTQVTNGKEIDMTSLIIKQIQSELTRDEVLQVINDNIIKNSDEI
jgi:ribosomal protein L19E